MTDIIKRAPEKGALSLAVVFESVAVMVTVCAVVVASPVLPLCLLTIPNLVPWWDIP